MQIEAKTLLYDMHTACERLFAFCAGKEFAIYKQDAYFRSAVERQFPRQLAW
jgi:hypothetical protein